MSGMWASRFYSLFIIVSVLAPLFVFGLGLCRRFSLAERLFSVAGLVMAFLIGTLTGTALFALLWSFSINTTVLLPLVLVLLLASGLYLLRPGGHSLSGPPLIVKIPECSWRITLIVVIIVLFMLIAASYPLKQIGAPTDDGGSAYRLYFSSDYLKHVAIVEEVVKGEFPPRNPYFTPEPLHYYWLFYVVPSVFTHYGVPALQSMMGYHLILGLCFMMVLWHLCIRWSGGRQSAVWLFAMMLTGPSLEGLYVFYRFGHEMTQVLPFISRYNIDAVTRWFFGHPQFDGMYRAMIYTPQHLYAVLCLCAVLMLFPEREAEESRSAGRSVIQGVLVAFAFLSSAIIGAIMSLWFGMILLQRWFRASCSLHSTIVSFAAGLPVVLAVLLAVVGSMVAPEGSGFLTSSPSVQAMAMIVGLNFGWLVPCALASLFLAFRVSVGLWREWLLLILSLGLGFFVQIKDFPTDIGLKAGLVIIIALGPLAALTLTRFFQMFAHPICRFFFHTALAIAVISSLPTLLIDIYNAGDTGNRGFTSVVRAEEMAACRWIRENLPTDAVIQANPHSGEAFWSLIPTFAARRTAVGDEMHSRIFQIDHTEYMARKAEVTNAFASFNPIGTLTTLQRLSIEYLFISEADRTAYRHAITKFDTCPHLFTKVFQQGGVSIYRVRDGQFLPGSIDVGDGEQIQLDILNPSSTWPLTLTPIFGETRGICPRIASATDSIVAAGRKETHTFNVRSAPRESIGTSLTQIAVSFPTVLTYRVADLHSQTGSKVTTADGDTVLQTLPDQPGFVLYGPYEFFPAGQVNVTCLIQPQGEGALSSDADVLPEAGYCDIHAPTLKSVLLERRFSTKEIQTGGSLTLEVVLDAATMLEFRLYTRGNTVFKTRGFIVELCEPPVIIPLDGP